MMNAEPFTDSPQDCIAVFGGTFDPPHVGHVLAAHYVLLTEAVSRIFIIPAAQHPFGKQHIAFHYRLEMCRIAFASLGEVAQVLDIEGNRRGASYTIDTVRELSEIYPGKRFLLVIGSDILKELPLWKDWDELKKIVQLRVLSRFDEYADSPNLQKESYFLPRISSTHLRRMLSAGQDVSLHVPRKVLDYIRENNLYGDSCEK